MKSLWATLSLSVLLTSAGPRHLNGSSVDNNLPVVQNLVVVTIDGFRWQEVFTGADEDLLTDEDITPDTSMARMLYWENSREQRRKKLMPFFWNVIANKGQLFGNRDHGNDFNIANLYAVSYPGYNEMFTGNTDISIASNKKVRNPNINVFDYLNGIPEFSGKIAAFTSWDVFPYILNSKRSGLLTNSGYESDFVSGPAKSEVLDHVQRYIADEEAHTRDDRLTFTAAKSYMQKERPRLMYIGLGQADEFAHQGRYDLYLNQAAEFDHMMADLWTMIQTTEGYKNNTVMLITTDHGRGKGKKWTSHNKLIRGSSQGWMAIMGPGIEAKGELKNKEEYYLEQFAQTIACLLGERFKIADPAPPIALQ